MLWLSTTWLTEKHKRWLKVPKLQVSRTGLGSSKNLCIPTEFLRPNPFGISPEGGAQGDRRATPSGSSVTVQWISGFFWVFWGFYGFAGGVYVVFFLRPLLLEWVAKLKGFLICLRRVSCIFRNLAECENLIGNKPVGLFWESKGFESRKQTLWKTWSLTKEIVRHWADMIHMMLEKIGPLPKNGSPV